MKKTHIVILIFSLVNILLAFSQHRWDRREILKYDGSGYYLYLPAVFIYNDIGELKFYPKIDSIYRPSDNMKNYALYKNDKNNRLTNKYAIGTAIGEMPFFLLAHLHTKNFNTKEPADGYSVPYQFSVGISNICWTIIGMLLLGSFLRRYYSDNISALTLLIIGFGTNLYCYTNIEMGLSHTLVFMLFSGILYQTERWYNTKKLKHAILLGLLSGWVLIARPVDFLVILIPLFWPYSDSTGEYKAKWALLWAKRDHVLFCAVCCLLFASLQLLYWKYTSGNFIHFSYEEESFNFNDPQILDGLFSFRKGWFVYTPIALIAMFGLIPMYFQKNKLLLPIVIFYIPFIYVVFSWWMWWYGWGFGARPMVETYAVLTLPLSALLFWISKQNKIVIGLACAVFVFFIWLNIYQTEQYNMGAIHGNDMNQKFYWRIWNKMHASPEDWKYLKL